MPTDARDRREALNYLLQHLTDIGRVRALSEDPASPDEERMRATVAPEADVLLVARHTEILRWLYPLLPKWGGSYVYVLCCPPGRFKIGLSVQPIGRRLAIQTANPETLYFYAVIPIADDNGAKAEAILHERFEAWRRQGEWFQLERTHLVDIDAMMEFSVTLAEARHG